MKHTPKRAPPSPAAAKSSRRTASAAPASLPAELARHCSGLQLQHLASRHVNQHHHLE